MNKSNKVVPIVFLGVMVIVLTVVITLTVSNNSGTELSPQQEQVTQRQLAWSDQVTMGLTQEQREIFEDITRGYICNCGSCEDMVLYECDCATPGGAQELHEFIVHYLNEGRSQEEIDELLHQNYDMKVNPDYQL